jgi:rhodanese-related sulfurtransferase
MQTAQPCPPQLILGGTTEILPPRSTSHKDPGTGHPSLYKDILEFMLELEITPEAFAQQRKQQQPPLLLDVREPWEYQTASIPSSLLMPMGEVSSRAHTELDPDAPIVVMCHHGARSLNVALWLRDQGFPNAQSLSGGIDAWSRSIDPNIPRY